MDLLSTPDFAATTTKLEEMILVLDTVSVDLQTKVDKLSKVTKHFIVKFVDDNKASLIENLSSSMETFEGSFSEQRERQEKLMVGFNQIKAILSSFELGSDAGEQ